MALYYSILRKLASSSIAPIAIRAVGSPRSFRFAISTVLNEQRGLHGTRLSFLSSHSFSTAVAKKKLSSDDGLLRIIDSEIAQAEENEDHDSLKIPSEFPFKVQDNPGERTVLLSRKYQNEDIKILVDMPNPEPDQDDDDDDDDGGADADANGDEDKEYVVQASIPLVVSVSKGNGLCLEFGITAFPDDISIDNLSIKNPESSSEDQIAYEGPNFEDLDEKMQGAFYKFLEVRGIKPSTMNIILKYMINKNQTEYKVWLENLKSFVNK